MLTLPRGGVPAAFEIAGPLESPLGLIFIRKLGAPFNPEFPIGAVAGGPDPVIIPVDTPSSCSSFDANDRHQVRHFA